ncbi:hypothetical protein SY88_12795 [Clostridiales bacterium PH28_bin88]|nr:hypothetical protein SY88_12795 [Clostridiales bacterium PH28_bin88]
MAGLFCALDEQGEVTQVIKVTGSFYKVTPGDQLTIWGTWQTHRQYGEQLAVERYERPVPTSLEALKSYLGSGLVKGVGPVTAGRIVDHFGEATLAVAMHEPHRLAEVRGISPEKAGEIGRAVEETLAFQQVVSFLLPYGVTARMALRIFRQLGSATIDRVRENPYVLTEVDLIGFARADAIARAMGLAGESPYRIRAALTYVLKEAAERDGHCFLPPEELAARALEKLNTSGLALEDLQRELNALVEMGQVVMEEGRAYLAYYHFLEERAARRVKEFLAVPAGPAPRSLAELLDAYQAESGITLAAAQQEAVSRVCTEGFLVLTGGPGTGKTQTIRAAIEVFSRLRQIQGMECRIRLAAPTGRASRRMAEVTGFEAMTLHRLLGLKPGEHAAQEVKADLLVVDEFSMVDLPLFESLIHAVEPGTKVLLVGDADQLPSVGPGNVLKDLLAAGVAAVHLTEIFRQAAESQVVLNAHRINRGEVNLEAGRDFFFIQEEQPEAMAGAVLRVVERYLQSGGSLEEIQVLTPMKKGPLGTVALNALLQERFNPPAPDKGEVPRDRWTLFRTGDKVIQLTNDYLKEVFNGDIGRVREVRREEEGPVLVVDFPDAGAVEYTEDELEALNLAHAITVHKSQGSEYRVVVMPVTTQHYVMLARNLIYTAITRAREKVVLVGTRRALGIAIRNNRVMKRCTSLAERIGSTDLL